MLTHEIPRQSAVGPSLYTTKVAESPDKWWYDRYPAWSAAYAQIVKDRNARGEQLASGGHRLLDLGCGFGDMLYLLREKHVEKHGVDPALIMVQKTADNLQRYGLSDGYFVRQAVAESLPYDAETFDTVTLLDVFEHVQPGNRRAALLEIRRVLKPGGELILATPSRHILRFWNVVDNVLSLPMRLVKKERLRIWRFTERDKDITEEFCSRRELETAVEQAQLELKHFERVSFYPAPETVGFLAPLLRRSYHIPFVHRIVGSVFRAASKCRLLNQKMLIRCVK